MIDITYVLFDHGMHSTDDRYSSLAYRYCVATVICVTCSFYSIEQLICDKKNLLFDYSIHRRFDIKYAV